MRPVPYTLLHGPSNHQPFPTPHPHAELFVSTHAAEELEDDHLTILDLENVILTGEIAARQRDAKTREIKYVIEGVTLGGESAEAVIKLGFTGKLIVITVYIC